MTLDEIVEACRGPLPTREALRAGAEQAEALAPHVYERVERVCDGECLMPRDANLVYFGLNVLAAARHKALWQHLVALARVPEDELDDLLAGAQTTLAQLMLSAWDGDAGHLMHLIEHADVGSSARAALFDTLARLTFDGRIPRQETSAFLERYEREGLADADAEAWIDWMLTVTRLGLVELEPALDRVFSKPILEHADAGIREERLAEMRKAAASPDDAAAFDDAGVRAIDDAGDAIAWLEESLLAMSDAAVEAGQPIAELDATPDDDDDPAAGTRLDIPDLDWLGRFLVSRQATASTMPLAMVDGYLTAIALGPTPTLAKPADFIGKVWGEAGEEPSWRGDQREIVVAMLTRHWQSILARRTAGAVPRPLLVDPDDPDAAAAWADGFLYGIDAGGDAWSLLLADRRAGDDIESIEALGGDDGAEDMPPASPAEAAVIIERLPRILQRIATYWDDPSRGYQLGSPVKVQKVGRNDPCPCGSGKKYKKCCGLNPPPMH